MMNKRAFFLSIDLVLTLVLVVFLVGILGLFLHNTIGDFAHYKQNTKMQATLNIALNQLSLSDLSCNLVDAQSNIIKKIGFCVPKGAKIIGLFSNLDFNVSVMCLNAVGGLENCFNSSFNSGSAKEYIATDVFLLVPDTQDVNKQKYFLCTEGQCDINKQVRVYVWQ